MVCQIKEIFFQSSKDKYNETLTSIENAKHSLKKEKLKVKNQILANKNQKIEEKLKFEQEEIDRIKAITNKSENEDLADKPLLEEGKIDPLANKAVKINVNANNNAITLTEALYELDQNFQDVTAIAKSICSGFPPKIPEITLTDEESPKSEEAQTKIKELETYLSKYGPEFVDNNWHGRASFERILWQDETFLKAIHDPLVIKTILINAKAKTEKIFPNNNTLSGLMLYGLNGSRLSFLTTVPPNWRNLAPGVKKEHMLQLVQASRFPVQESPREVTLDYLMNVSLALNSMREVLIPLQPLNAVHQPAVVQAIHDASIPQLLHAFKTLVHNDIKARAVIKTQWGSEVPDMACQTCEVMAFYHEVLKEVKGNHEEALGFSLVSHALDPRHMAATLFVTNYPESNAKKHFNTNFRVPNDTNKQDVQNTALNNFNRLIEDASSGNLNEKATTLIRIRLQQMITILTDPASKINSKEIIEALQIAHPTV